MQREGARGPRDEQRGDEAWCQLPSNATQHRIPAVGPGPANPSGGNLPIPNMPPWAKWVVGAVIVAIPIYRRFRTLEDKIEKTAEVAIEVVDTVAEATEKLAGEVADAFPGNENLKEAASRIKTVTDAIEGDAEKAEALIHKRQRRLALWSMERQEGLDIGSGSMAEDVVYHDAVFLFLTKTENLRVAVLVQNHDRGFDVERNSRPFRHPGGHVDE
ncbi:uncharacterized protein C2845_PM16G09280 [Panicum miliaceum]|uniref:Uncharacterized protein n=1 Tax=Panicum miliaceum TaxID=4540 RepID=A0A3L6PV65_PANMI|nr:uncharacterized protein C2845_PM16G09280 [Panicum miliaceum]